MEWVSYGDNSKRRYISKVALSHNQLDQTLRGSCVKNNVADTGDVN